MEENYAGIDWTSWTEPVLPIGFDGFPDDVAEWFDTTPARRSPNGAKRTAKPSDRKDHIRARPDPVELILYVSSESVHCAAAIRTVKQVVSRFERSRVRLTVRDLTENPALGAADNVAFTPTLVRRNTQSRTFILGHLSNPAVLLDLLADCEEKDN